MKTVILVPYRESNVTSRANWDRTFDYLLELDAPIFIGDKPGEWSRAGSINVAAKKADSWDVAIIVDADTVQVPTKKLLEDVQMAYAHRSAVVPWNVRWRLNQDATENLEQTLTTFDPQKHLDWSDGFSHNDAIKEYPAWRVGSTIIYSRAAWNAVNGFDEHFVKWGWEDCANRLAVETLAPGGLERTHGEIFHMWHPMDQRGNTRSQARFRDYKNAHGSRAKMLKLVNEPLPVPVAV